MDMLDEYLYGRLRTETREVGKLTNFLVRVIEQFTPLANVENGTWPYKVSEAESIKEEAGYSFSTNGMILFALAVTTGRLKHAALLPVDPDRPELKWRDQPSEVIDRGTANLLARCRKHKDTKDVLTRSSTYGDNDPFTLAWLIEVLALAEKTEGSQTLLDELFSECDETIARVFKDPRVPVLKYKDSEFTPIAHMFPLLRVIHLYHSRGRPQSVKIDTAKRFVLEQIHLHLSYSEIEDSSFDAAELVFAIESSLLIDRNLLGSSLLSRAFDVIRLSQKRSPYWRPLRPFIANQQGLALLPLSIEIANSLLRICAIVDEESPEDSLFSEHTEMFSRYTRWLMSRVVEGQTEEGHSFVGWHSEHVGLENEIHLWETSQVALYLTFYAALLQKHVARTSLKKARFQVAPVPRKVSDLDGQSSLEVSPETYWKATWQTKEPAVGCEEDSGYRIYHEICRDYLVCRNPSASPAGRTPHVSMLLYGPPGTGKTSIAEQTAASLGWPLITITPSDFIAQGESAVEARAKAIFTTLEQQSDVVVLFDEIDRLILDRDSSQYQKQSDTFQFMTPGMLTKVRNLWKTQKLIFIIATNYAERIDPAIKRRGRIDDRYLVMPPDFEQRQLILMDRISKHAEELDVTQLDLASISRKTVLATYGELEQLVADSVEPPGQTESGFLSNLKKLVAGFQPTIRLASYKPRFECCRDDGVLPSAQEPWEEFLLLAYLVAEVADGYAELDNESKEVVRKVFSSLEYDNEEAFRRSLDLHLEAKDRGKIRKALVTMAKRIDLAHEPVES
jgi:ATPase family protein associated with various cellular activities (AAA)